MKIGILQKCELNDPQLGSTTIFCNGYINLFLGRSQHDWFIKYFCRVILESKEGFLWLGAQDGDLGSHSASKDACSFATAGSMVSPPIMSVCLHAMNMGTVKEQYLHHHKVSDQYLGCVVSTMKSNNYLFAASPLVTILWL